MDLRSGPPPPPRGKRAVQAYHDDHRMEGGIMVQPSAGAGYHVPRRLGEREPDRGHPEDHAAAYAERIPLNILAETPETTVGENVHVKGELSFERLLRVDGSFKGKLVSVGDLVVGAKGVIRGSITDLREIISDGTIIGNITAERVRLRRSAIVMGDITCQSLSMDPDVSVSGKLNVHKEAPSKLHIEGEEAPEDEVADSNDDTAYASDNNSKSTDGDHRQSKSRGGGSKKEGSSKKEKESAGADRDRRSKDDKDRDKDKEKDKDKDKDKDKGKDESSRKNKKEGGSGESSKSKTSGK